MVCFCSLNYASAQVLKLDVRFNDGEVELIDALNSEVMAHSFNYAKLNYNPLFPVSQCSEFKLDASNTIQTYTIFKGSPELESCIWSLQSGEDEIITTERRLIDLKHKNYVNYSSNIQNAYLINYHYNKSDTPFSELRMGNYNSDYDFPIQQNNGWIGRSIVYSRLPSPAFNNALQTALILSYGLSIDEQMPLLSFSNEQSIWKVENDYRFDLRGIGRDDQAGLHQKQSVLKTEAYSLAFALEEFAAWNSKNYAELRNGQYILWAANKTFLDFQKDELSQDRSSTSWEISTNTTREDIAMEFKSTLVNSMIADRDMWLIMSDPKANDLQSNSYYKLEKHGPYFTTDNIQLEDGLIAAVAMAEDFLIDYQLDAGSCDLHAESVAILDLRIIGCSYPATVDVNLEGKLIKRLNIEDDAAFKIELEAWGSYEMYVKDQYTSENYTFVINPTESEEINIQREWVLQNDEKHYLDVSHQVPFGWSAQWTTPEGVSSLGGLVTLQEAGEYTLVLSKAACEITKHVNVVRAEDFELNANVFPNPTATGEVNLELLLDTESDLVYNIFSGEGQFVRSGALPSNRYHKASFRLDQAGIYFIEIRSAGISQTQKIIVQP